MKYFAVLDKKNPVGMARRFRGMCHHKNRLSFPVDRAKQLQQSVGRPGIQRPRRFICQNQLRTGDQCAGNRRPLLLSAGNLIRIFLKQHIDPKLFGNRPKPLLHLLHRCICQDKWQKNVIF